MKRKVGKSQYAGIPANEREQVRRLFHLYQAADKSRPQSPQQIYRSVIEGRKAKQVEEAAKVAKRQKENKIRQRDSARDALSPAINSLAGVRDVLRNMANGDDICGSPETSAMFCHAALVEGAGKLEQALFDLGLIKLDEIGGDAEGMFVECLKRKSEGGSNAA
jgi:hypothetical protein